MKIKAQLHADDFGRSKEISKKILECVEYGNISSVSVMVGFYNFTKKEIKILKKNCKFLRLHLNLTDQNMAKKNLNTFSYLYLIFISFFCLKDKKLEFSINYQINLYKKIFNFNEIRLDGHQHVHLLPCVIKILKKNNYNYKINELRYINEKIYLYSLFDFNNFFNIMKLIFLKFLSFLSKNEFPYNKNFYGVSYSGFQNINLIKKYKKKIFKKNKKLLEVLIHPGFTDIKEKKLFDKKFYLYHSSKKRKNEYDIAFSKVKV